MLPRVSTVVKSMTALDRGGTPLSCGKLVLQLLLADALTRPIHGYVDSRIKKPMSLLEMLHPDVLSNWAFPKS